MTRFNITWPGDEDETQDNDTLGYTGNFCKGSRASDKDSLDSSRGGGGGGVVVHGTYIGRDSGSGRPGSSGGRMGRPRHHPCFPPTVLPTPDRQTSEGEHVNMYVCV